MKFKKSLIVFILIVLGGIFGRYQYLKYHIPPVVKFAGLNVTDMSGHPYDMSALRGKPVLVNFYATWCGPCMHEMHTLAPLSSIWAQKGIRIVCISDESPDRIMPVASRFASDIIFLRLAHRSQEIGVYTYPTSYLLSAEGAVVYQMTDGSDQWEDPAFISRLEGLVGIQSKN